MTSMNINNNRPFDLLIQYSQEHKVPLEYVTLLSHDKYICTIDFNKSTWTGPKRDNEEHAEDAIASIILHKMNSYNFSLFPTYFDYNKHRCVIIFDLDDVKHESIMDLIPVMSKFQDIYVIGTTVKSNSLKMKEPFKFPVYNNNVGFQLGIICQQLRTNDQVFNPVSIYIVSGSIHLIHDSISRIPINFIQDVEQVPRFLFKNPLALRSKKSTNKK